MIPWRLTFSGIRDYLPTHLDLSGENSHIMITGPNGSGKSTITFCMGAVLYSSKVDVEGLKSRNLAPDKTWKAKISLLLKNEGKMKIDAPAFVEFTLKIIQDPGQPLKKEFSISTGDVVDQWEETVRYTSGDRFYNFTAYKRDLQYKYKVDPDLFYLIWYQQEVNQFAVMNPEERFRVFSEMHGIDQVQRDWEESMEKVKDTQESLRVAESNVKLMKSELSMKKAALDRFLDNQKRLMEGGSLYAGALFQLEEHYKKEIKRLEELVLNLEEDIAEAKDDLTVKKGLKEHMAEQLESFKSKHRELDLEITEEEQKRDEMDEKIKQLLSRVGQLDLELEAITKKKNLITRTEDEVKAALSKLSEEQDKTNKEFQRNSELLNEQNEAWQNKVELITSLQQEIQNDEKWEQIHLERLHQHKSSHAVQEEIDFLEAKVTRNKNVQFTDTQKLNELKEELRLLKENRDLSVRQMESMKFFSSLKIKAYPLRELLELDESAQLKDEPLYNAIKYTIFFNGKQIIPPNDLYHVPLMMVIPDRVVTKLPSHHLQVKNGLNEEELTHAMKALWWVEQFFKEGSFSIKNGTLIDPMGIRGPQEKDRYILSMKALKLRRQEVEKLVSDLTQKLSNLDKEITADTKTIQELNSIIHQVREAEAFMTNEHQRVTQKRKLDEEGQRRDLLKDNIKELEQEKNRLMRLQIQQENFEKVLDEEAEIYEELGKMKDKYEERNQLKDQCFQEKELYRMQKSKLEGLYDDFEQVERTISRSERDIRNLDDVLQDMERKISAIEKQKKNGHDDQETIQAELVNVIQELGDLQKLVPDIYSETINKDIGETLITVSQLKKNRENGKVMFDNARTEAGIDPAAQENYDTIKQEFERLDSEYKRTSVLLEQDMERTENLKDQLETTINMRVLELQQRFKYYMSQFQFEGEISWDSFEDRRQRTHFQLFIKARKEGHRGTLEDVSIKARGGRVGKGVSGGEESLSSLLFALALLQNLQTTPGFIVLDEFDSALDEQRKVKVFDLYESELKRKLIILTPKSHENTYLDRFTKAFVVQHDPTIPQSKVVGIVKTMV
ncbi:chromosome segregation protein SMC [Bacillus sp. EB106-08-02-XG196]|uniref:chromosome segregation protein SMC n=1 Tax=Bacillus sp. EB106-08-02-XG196 TaxID=2737049 RepID=UPI0015C41902|nr:chromosome segregation protein SMC [Bacillus sp. EB106-08-02-XG196]NWQ42518.1 chromosome segregation protein SMC [Bacillus sp. EB106-08-02-XG196]